MLRDKPWKANSYFYKIVFLVALSGAVPALILGLFAYVNIAQSARERAEESGAYMLQQLQAQIEHSMQSTDQLAGSLASSPLAIEATRRHLTERDYDTVFQLEKSVNFLKASRVDINDVQLVSLEQRWTIGSTENRLSNMSKNALDSRYIELAEDARTSYWKRESEGGGALLLVKKIPHYSANPTGLLIVEFDATNTANTVPNSQLGQLSVFDAKKERMVGGPMPIDGSESETILAGIRQSPLSEGGLSFHKNGVSMLIKFRKSHWNDWVYVYSIENSIFNRDSRAIAQLVLYVCLGVLGFSSLVTYIGSRSLYGPIGRLFASVVGRVGYGSNRRIDELSMIGERIQHLLQSDIQLKVHWPQVKELVARKVFLGEISPQECPEKQELLGYSTGWRQHVILAMQLDSLANTRFENKDKDLLFFAVQNIAAELIPEDTRIGPVLVNQCLVLLVGISENENTLGAYRMAQMVSEHVKEYLQLTISVGMSAVFTDIGEAHMACDQAQTALKYRDRLGPDLVTSFSDINREGIKPPHYPLHRERELTGAIKAADEPDVREALQRFLDELFSQPCRADDYEIALTRLLVSTIQNFQEAGGELHRLFGEGESLFAQLSRKDTLGEIEVWLRDTVISPMVSQLKEAAGTQYRTISQEMLSIIREKYDTDLTLEYCAYRLNYNPSYLGRVFKKETGIGFAEYLAHFRLEMAKSWLVDTDMTLTDISDKLLYHNPPNFSRYFKKMVGQSPGKFRQLNRRYHG